MKKQTQDNLQNRYQLHSSQFINIAFGKYTNRNDMVNFIKDPSLVPEPNEFARKRMNWGVKHEVDGIANWLIRCSEGKFPNHTLDDQKDFLFEDFDKLDTTSIDLSSKPDGLSQDEKTIIEVKCPNEGGKLREDFDLTRLPQIFGQQLVLKKNGFPIEKTQLCEWTPHTFRVWNVYPDEKFEEHLISLLKEFTKCLLVGEEITDKPKRYSGKYETYEKAFEVKLK